MTFEPGETVKTVERDRIDPHRSATVHISLDNAAFTTSTK